jgi:acetylornithine deacetylase
MIRGAPGHVLDTASATNAIEKSYLIMSALRELEEEMNRGEFPPSYRDFAHPLNLNIGILRGGDWPSTVPAKAEFHCRMAFFPGTTYGEICQKIIQTVKQAAEKDPWLRETSPTVEFYGLRSEGYSVSRKLPALMTLNSCHKSLEGKEAESFKLTATTDCRAFYHFGNAQATCYGPNGRKIHAENECVDMDSVINTSKVYALFLSRWCGLVE